MGRPGVSAGEGRIPVQQFSLSAAGQLADSVVGHSLCGFAHRDGTFRGPRASAWQSHARFSLLVLQRDNNRPTTGKKTPCGEADEEAKDKPRSRTNPNSNCPKNLDMETISATSFLAGAGVNRRGPAAIQLLPWNPLESFCAYRSPEFVRHTETSRSSHNPVSGVFQNRFVHVPPDGRAGAAQNFYCISGHYRESSFISRMRRSHWVSAVSRAVASGSGSGCVCGVDSGSACGNSGRGIALTGRVTAPFRLSAALKQARPISASFHRETGIMIFASRSIAQRTPLI